MVAQTRDTRQAAIARALDRAQAQASQGNRPTLVATSFDGAAIRETWQVASRTTAGQVYTVSLTRTASAITTACDCQAAGRGLVCWHRALGRLAHLDTIPSRNRAGIRIRPRQ